MAKKKSKKEVIATLKGKLQVLEDEIRNDISIPVVASFGFIIALVWRDAIRGIIDEVLIRAGLTGKAYLYNIISAIIVTVIIMALMILISKFNRAKKKKRIKERFKEIKEK